MIVFEARRVAVVGVIKDVTHSSIESKGACISGSVGLVLLGCRHRAIGLAEPADLAVGIQDIHIVKIDPTRLTTNAVLWSLRM